MPNVDSVQHVKKVTPMATSPVLKMGDPRLLRQAKTVENFGSPELRGLVDDLFDTMQAEGGVGLAAPQIGVDLAVVVFGFVQSARYPDAAPVPRTALVNPEIVVLSSEQEEGWEGCLSIPGLRGSVPRHTHILYRGFDAEGQRVEREATGFHARVVQHECDHLAGVLYPMRIRDFSRFGFSSVLFPELGAGSR